MTSPIIDLKRVTKTFDSGGTVGLHDVTFRINPGEFVAITGPSGAGKSTLLNILGLLDDATSGEYVFDGQLTRRLGDPARDVVRSRDIGFVFQSSFMLPDLTALENAALGLRVQATPIDERAARAASALDLVGMLPRAATTARLLSGGEKQRTAIARAIAPNPRVVLADEPTGNLDSRNSTAVIDYLRVLNMQGTTIIVITHDAEVAAAASRQIKLVDGRIISDSSEQRPPQIPVNDARPPVRRARRQKISWADDAADAVASLGRRIARTLLIVTAFTLGISGLVLAIGMSESAAAQVSNRLTEAALDEVRVIVPGSTTLFQPGDSRLDDWMVAISSLPHVQNVAFYATTGTESAKVRRLDPNDPSPLNEVYLMTASDSYFDVMEARSGATENIGLLENPAVTDAVWVGPGVVESLGLATFGPGSTLVVDGRSVDVVGGITASERAPHLDRALIVSRDVMARLGGADVTIVIRVDPGFPASIATAVPLALDAANPGQFTVQTVADLRNLRYGVSNDLGAFVAVMSAILLALAAVGASTTMYVSVQARTAEIALRRAIGSSKRAVARLFLVEGTIVGVVGGAVGAFVGTIAVLIVAATKAWAPVLPPELVPLAILLGLATGIASSIVPALSAARKDPASAMRL